MRALTVIPGQSDAVAVREVPEPHKGDGTALVQSLAVGVCGTDREIAGGAYGSVPPGCDYLVLGHESLGRVGIVRRPDPVPCPNCAIGEWDMCRNGRYTECGIKERHGFCAERFRCEPEFLVKLDPALQNVGVLVEPTSVVAKAWEQIDRIGGRAAWSPKRVLVTGAGPIGLLAALLAVQRGLDVHVLDRVTEGPKPSLVRDLGATYHTGKVEAACNGADVVVECTGVGQLVFDAMRYTAPAGIVCLTGLSSGGRPLSVDAGALNRTMVLENDVVFGSVNANRRHYEAAARALADADREWLGRLITRRVPLDRWQDALQHDPLRDVKTVIELGD
jgi:threonine dehydrogenase-like Zn-dependent dehydrogenase